MSSAPLLSSWLWPWLWPGMALVLGLVVGSFLNVVIHRLPIMLEREWRRQCEALLAHGAGSAAGSAATAATTTDKAPADEPYNLLRPRSACPACAAPIRPWHNVPVFGWLWLRGRCAACGASIAVRYPVVELGTGLLSGALAWRFGLTPACVGALLLTWSLIALTVIDLDHQLLPDSITLPLLWGGLLFHLLTPSSPAGPFAGLQDGVIGAIAGYTSLWLVYHGFRLVTGKEGMGYGDFKLLAALGAWLGWQMLPLVILLSALTGAVTGVALIALRRHERQAPLPFGPFLAAAGLVALFWGRDLMSAYFLAAG